MKFKLHFGAHKTGSTFLQNSLVLSNAALGQHGCYAASLEEARSGISRIVRRATKGVISVDQARKAVADYAKRLPAGTDTVLISEENMIGLYMPSLRRGSLYPEMERSLGKIQEVMAEFETETWLTIRSYDTHFYSFYCEALRWYQCDPIESYSQKYLRNANWAGVIRRLADFTGQEVKVILFEDLIGDPKSQLARFANVQPEEITLETRRDLKTSFDAETLAEVLAVQSEGLDRAAYRMRIEEIDAKVAQRPKGAIDPVWSDRQRRKLVQRYKTLCDGLAG